MNPAMATTTDELRRLALDHLWMHNVAWTEMETLNEPLMIVGGKGLRVTDSDGGSWIDVNGGYASVTVGYGRDEIAAAVQEQMEQIAYFPIRTAPPATIRLAAKLAEITPGSLSRTFFVSGGSEANETALKIARAFHHRQGEDQRHKIISRRGSYHGATGGVLWLGAMPGALKDYGPPNPSAIYAPQPNLYRCEFNSQSLSECAQRCAQAIEDLIVEEGPETVAAVIAEPIAGGMGAAVPGDEYWPMVREICDRYGVLLIADEIVTGFGQTGKLFGLEHWNVVPDIMSIAKGMCSTYIPLGATVVTQEIAEAFSQPESFFNHVFTAAGHPVATAAGYANIDIILNEGLVNNAVEMGAYMKGHLDELYERHPIIGDVRGLGLMNSIEFVADRQTKARFAPELKIQQRLSQAFKERGLILRAHGDTIVNMFAPLCITKRDIEDIAAGVDEAIGAVERDIKT